MKKKSKLFTLLTLLSISAYSCALEVSNNFFNSGTLITSVNFPEKKSNSFNIKFIPVETESIVLKIEGEGIKKEEPIFFQLDRVNNKKVLEYIPQGDKKIKAQAYDKDGILIAKGESSVKIIPSQINKTEIELAQFDNTKKISDINTNDSTKISCIVKPDIKDLPLSSTMEKAIRDSGCKIELPDEKNSNIKVIPQKLTNYTPGANAIVFDVQPNMKPGMTFDVFDKSNVFVEKLVVGSINGNTINLLNTTTNLANCPCIVTFKPDIVSNNINTDPTVIIPLRYNIDTPSTVIIPLRYNIGVTSKITNYTSGSNSITFDSKPDVQPGATFEVYDKSNTFVEKLIAGSIIGNTVNLLNTTTTPANCPCVVTFKPNIIPSNIDTIPNINDSGSTVIIPIRLITTLASSSTSSSSSSNTPVHVGSKTISANVGVLDGPPVDNIPITVGP